MAFPKKIVAGRRSLLRSLDHRVVFHTVLGQDLMRENRSALVIHDLTNILILPIQINHALIARLALRGAVAPRLHHFPYDHEMVPDLRRLLPGPNAMHPPDPSATTFHQRPVLDILDHSRGSGAAARWSSPVVQESSRQLGAVDGRSREPARGLDGGEGGRRELEVEGNVRGRGQRDGVEGGDEEAGGGRLVGVLGDDHGQGMRHLAHQRADGVGQGGCLFDW